MAAPKNPQGRQPGAAALGHKSMNELYEFYSKKYGDPMEGLFKVASGKERFKLTIDGKSMTVSPSPEMQIAAREFLVKTRYPAGRMVEAISNTEGQLLISWADNAEPVNAAELPQIFDPAIKAITPN